MEKRISAVKGLEHEKGVLWLQGFRSPEHSYTDINKQCDQREHHYPGNAHIKVTLQILC